ncbi:hypothetical protein [Salinibacterium sp. TMP30]|uniref:hypothetical protein n=1 Tax=Salinibacterium sp. TMP30 TaxID=3138237 RepID=UPI00313A0F49
MTVDQNGGNALGVRPGNVDLPPSDRMPVPVAARTHTNRASGDTPIAEWLESVSAQPDNQQPDRPHRQYRRATHN